MSCTCMQEGNRKERRRLLLASIGLVMGVSYFNFSEKFGIGESTAHETVAEFSSVIHRNLGHLLQFPNGDHMVEVSRKVEAYRGLPNCVGAIDFPCEYHCMSWG